MISSETLKKAIAAAEKNLKKYSASINAIDVFPEPDHDAGTNLLNAISACAEAASSSGEKRAGALVRRAAEETSRRAEGHSGVILSAILRGFAKEVEKLDLFDAKALAKGLGAGCDEAYASLDKPVEGTMLTVARIAASKARDAAQKGENARETFLAALKGAKAALESTPNLLPALKRRGTVDAGALGLVRIMEGTAGADD